MENESIIDHLSRVVRDGLDYVASLITLFQARLAEYALSFIVFAHKSLG